MGDLPKKMRKASHVMGSDFVSTDHFISRAVRWLVGPTKIEICRYDSNSRMVTYQDAHHTAIFPGDSLADALATAVIAISGAEEAAWDAASDEALRKAENEAEISERDDMIGL